MVRYIVDCKCKSTAIPMTGLCVEIRHADESTAHGACILRRPGAC
jgi:hypothetical protein